MVRRRLASIDLAVMDSAVELSVRRSRLRLERGDIMNSLLLSFEFIVKMILTTTKPLLISISLLKDSDGEQFLLP